MAASILAVIRASGVCFRDAHAPDRLAFAVHAAILTSGYRLVGVGDDALLEGIPPDAADVPPTGWDAHSGDRYTFSYLPEGGGPALMAKALVVGGALCVTCARAAPASGVGAPPPPQVISFDGHNEDGVLDLDLARFVPNPGDPSPSRALAHLDELAECVGTAAAAAAADGAAAGGAPGGSGAGADARGGGAAAGARGDAAEPEPGRLGGRSPPPSRSPPPYEDDPLRIGPPMRPRVAPGALEVGHEDLMPMYPGEGGRPPGVPHIGSGDGGVGMPPGGGGMHVGPGHPFFAGGGVRHPQLLPGRGHPPGARWDPIRPQGLEGWQPDDFHRPPPPHDPVQRTDPDLGPPPPGRGTDWDSMFG